MKLQGKVLNWNEDRGFGFVEPNGGGERAFVHIKAFKARSRRPVNGDVIHYELVREKNDRYLAGNIQFAKGAKHSTKTSKDTGAVRYGLVFTMMFFIALSASVLTGRLPALVIGLYLALSSLAFIVYAIDKYAAKNGHRRISERTLHIFSLIGGWPGALYAQTKLRHKSSKAAFKRVYWMTVLLNFGGLYWLHTEDGTHFLNQVVVPFFNQWLPHIL
jgi:uncharacterized membrane protein YsdA (DUF1294 family)/cold shock CspA family protein